MTAIESTSRLEALLDTARGEEAPETVEESLAFAIVRMTYSDLLRLARKAHHRGFDGVLELIRAEFRRRRRS